MRCCFNVPLVPNIVRAAYFLRIGFHSSRNGLTIPFQPEWNETIPFTPSPRDGAILTWQKKVSVSSKQPRKLIFCMQTYLYWGHMNLLPPLHDDFFLFPFLNTRSFANVNNALWIVLSLPNVLFFALYLCSKSTSDPVWYYCYYYYCYSEIFEIS